MENVNILFMAEVSQDILVSKNLNFPYYILKYTFFITKFIELVLISK